MCFPFRKALSCAVPLLLSGLLSSCAVDLPTGMGASIGVPIHPSPAHRVDVAEIVLRLNQERTAKGQAPLAVSDKLIRAARIHAEQMAAAGVMAHDLPGAPHPTLQSRVDAVGYSYHVVAENVAVGYSSAQGVTSAWMKSDGHRRNILDSRVSDVGAAVVSAADGRLFYASVFGHAR